MNRSQTILIIILGLTIVIGVYSMYLLIRLPIGIEWFQLYGLVFYVILFAAIYIFLLAIAGFITRLFKKDFSRPMLNGIVWSVPILAVTIGIGIFTGQRKVSETEEQMDKEWNSQYKHDAMVFKNHLDSLNSIIRIDSTNYTALVERGLLKRKSGQFEASIDDFKKALHINSRDFKANIEMGYSLQIMNRKEEADKYYKIAANLDTNSNFAKANRHYLYNEK